jgi:hypothetical protein
MARASRSSWKLTSRYSGIVVGSVHSMKTPVSLMLRVTTLANLTAPRASFHVTRPGSETARRAALMGAGLFVGTIVLLNAFIRTSKATTVAGICINSEANKLADVLEYYKLTKFLRNKVLVTLVPFQDD